MQGQIDSRAIELAAEARQIAKDARDQCQREYEGLSGELRSHREETNSRFNRQDQDRNRMHAENQVKFERLFRALYTATGILLAASVLLSRSGLLELLKFLGK